jgi:hypothetical protein
MTNSHKTIKLDLSLLTDTATDTDPFTSSALDSLLYNNLSEQSGAGLTDVLKKVGTKVATKVASAAKQQVVETGKNSFANAVAKVRELSPTRAGFKQSLSNAAAKVRELSPTRAGFKQSLSNAAAKVKDRLSPQRNSSTTSDGIPNVSRNNSSMQNANKLVNNLPVGQGVVNRQRNADANVFLPNVIRNNSSMQNANKLVNNLPVGQGVPNDTSSNNQSDVVDYSTTSQFSPQHPVDLESRVGTLEEQVAQIMNMLNSRS